MQSELDELRVGACVQLHGTDSFCLPFSMIRTDGLHNGHQPAIYFTRQDVFEILEINSMKDGKKRATLKCFSREAPHFDNIDSIHLMVEEIAKNFVIVKQSNSKSCLTIGMKHIFLPSRIRSICAFHLKNDSTAQKHHNINGATLLVIDKTESHFTFKLDEASNKPPLIFTLHILNAGIFRRADDIHEHFFDAQPALTKTVFSDQLFAVKQMITDQSSPLLDKIQESFKAVLTAQETERQKELAARDVQDNKNKRKLEESERKNSSLRNQLQNAQQGLLEPDNDWSPMNKHMFFQGHIHELLRKKAALERQYFNNGHESAGVDIKAEESAGASSHEAAEYARDQKRVKTETDQEAGAASRGPADCADVHAKHEK